MKMKNLIIIESKKGEMGEVREENERLKVLLAELVNEYESLQMHFFDILGSTKHHHQQGDHHDQATNKSTSVTELAADHNINNHTEENNDELVCLSLGFPSHKKCSTNNKDDRNHTYNSNIIKNDEVEKNIMGEGLGLGLAGDQYEQVDEATNINNNNVSSHHDQGKDVINTRTSNTNHQPQQLKKARVSIRARCDTQTVRLLYIFTLIHFLVTCSITVNPDICIYPLFGLNS